MKVDASLTGSITDAAAKGAQLEAEGYSGAWTAETAHDPFLPSRPPRRRPRGRARDVDRRRACSATRCCSRTSAGTCRS
ncbi:MAG: hypothetical protein R2697_07255 [Ilumatobacteraceae bacterium]